VRIRGISSGKFDAATGRHQGNAAIVLALGTPLGTPSGALGIGQVEQGIEHREGRTIGRRGRPGHQASGQDGMAFWDSEESALAESKARWLRVRRVRGDGATTAMDESVGVAVSLCTGRLSGP
jgi:hypothetical protein